MHISQGIGNRNYKNTNTLTKWETCAKEKKKQTNKTELQIWTKKTKETNKEK